MKSILEKLLPEWGIDQCGDCYDLEAWSPAGEDIVLTLCGSTFAELAKYAYEV